MLRGAAFEPCRLPIARKREAAQGVSEVERRSRSERCLARPSRLAVARAVRAFSGVASAARRNMRPSRPSESCELTLCP